MAITVQKIKNIETVSSVPSDSKLLITPDNGQYARATVPNIVGSAMDTTNDFKVNSTTNKVELKDKRFRGTTAEWETLTNAQKAEYTYVDLTDDCAAGPAVVESLTVTDDDQTDLIRFGVDENGNYGYYKVGADTVTPFKSGGGPDITEEENDAGGLTVTIGGPALEVWHV